MNCRLVTPKMRNDLEREREKANADIQRQVAEANKKIKENEDAAWNDFQSQVRDMVPRIVKAMFAVVTWQLHCEYGFGKKRLDRLMRNTPKLIGEDLKALGFLDNARWVPDDAVGSCHRHLQNVCGIDLNAPEYVELIGGVSPRVTEKKKENAEP